MKKAKKNRSNTEIVVAVILISILVLSSCVALLFYKLKHMDYDKICQALQNGAFPNGDANSFEPRAEAKDELRSDGTYIKTEIKYGDEFPNSYLDISYPGGVNEKRPTFIYWHGGGHIFGDKNAGDPLTPNSDVSARFWDDLCQNGFNFVNVNYCFAPEYRYPCQILQYDQALAYLNEHAEELHLDMDNVILGGGSGGAVYTSQWAMVLTSEEYRNEFNQIATNNGYSPIETPALERNQVKVLMLEAPPMIIDGMNEDTQILYKCWYGVDCIEDYAPAKLTHIVDYVTADYIPCFITAGNTDCYPEDAKELHEKLDAIGVDNSYYYVSADIEKLNHGYMSSFETSESARTALQQCIDFLKSKTKIK